MSDTLKHFRDPCVHCGLAMEDFAPGPCTGDPGKAVVVCYAVTRQAWENPGSGCDEVTCAMSNGDIVREYRHPAEHWAYNEWFKDARVMAPAEFTRMYGKKS